MLSPNKTLISDAGLRNDFALVLKLILAEGHIGTPMLKHIAH